jgi:trimeric autotransporter adhesin
MKPRVYTRTTLLLIIAGLLLGSIIPQSASAQENCPGQVLTSSTTCTGVSTTLKNALPTALIANYCGVSTSSDHWYQFVAKTAYPVIQLSGLGASLQSGVRLQLFTNSCAPLTMVGTCVSGTGATTLNLNTATNPGGAGLTVGATYYIRIFTNTTGTSGTSSNWNYTICVRDPVPGRIEISRSYINVTRGAVGGTVSPGDTLEMRATFVLFEGSTSVTPNIPNASADSIGFYDTLINTRGLALIPGTIALRTNEGIIYRADLPTKVAFTDLATDNDAGWHYQNGLDTIVRINLGGINNSSRWARGRLDNTSRPSVFNTTCIVMATYRVRVYAPFDTKICFKTGAFTYRDRSTGVLDTTAFKRDSLVVYNSAGLCPNSISSTNAIGVETNGTFGQPAVGAPLARNRGTTAFTPTYIYSLFSPASGGPGDYYYGITNNTSSTFTTNTALLKPDAGAFRVFNLWDITGDHTGAANTARGNRPCDTTQARSATNPCGYMLVINSSYKTDTAFQYTVNNLCPNTYYEIAAWFKNICSKCGGDSLGRSSGDAAYLAATPNDTSGIKPNIAFDINGTDYYTTGNLAYLGTLTGVGAQRASDSTNRWVKRGFTYLTGPSETSFQLTLRNNAPGGGGNDWAVDDIAVATCLPRMSFNPTTNPTLCRGTYITIVDTVRSYFNNYTNYKWQRSTDGVTWTDIAGSTGTATPTFTGGSWQYLTGYVVTPAFTTMANNGDRYRVIVATTPSNLTNTNCQVSDGVSIQLNILNCGVVLSTDLLSFNGKLVNDYGQLTWTTSKEDEPLSFNVERSNDGINFFTIGTVNGYNDINASINRYTFNDPVAILGKKFYRIVMVNRNMEKKYSRVIQLSKGTANVFTLVNVVNPFYDKIDFDISMPEDGKVDVQLIDMMGKTVKKSSFLAQEGINSLNLLNTDNLPAGMYIFQVSHQGTVLSSKVIKKSSL